MQMRIPTTQAIHQKFARKEQAMSKYDIQYNTVQTFEVFKIFFERSLLCLPMPHLFKQKQYRQDCEILIQFKATVL